MGSTRGVIQISKPFVVCPLRCYGGEMRAIRFFRAFLLVSSLTAARAVADTHWNLPADVTDRNTTLSVSVETGSGVLSGAVRALSGKMWLADPKDPTTIRAQIEVPPTDFETGNRERDLQLRAVALALGAGAASLDLKAANSSCFPGYVKLGRPCEGKLVGDLSFQGVRRPIDLPFTIRRDGFGYRVEGRLTLPGSAFVVADELKLILGFLKRVTVSYTCVL